MQKFNEDIDLDEKSEEVVKLQNFLINHGYLSAGLNTGYFGEQTEASVLKFQMDTGVVKSSEDIGAGRVGPKTRKVINDMF